MTTLRDPAGQPLDLQPPATPGGARRIVAHQPPRRMTAAPTAPPVVAVGASAPPVTAAPLTAAAPDDAVRDYLGRVIDVDDTEAATDAELEAARAADRATFATADLIAPRPYRQQPRRAMLTTFQAGHGWTVNSGNAWTADPTDYRLGSQSLRLTTPGTGVAQTLRRFGLPAVNFTSRCLSLLLKVDNPVNLNQLHIYVGTSGFANFVPLIAAIGGASANTTIPPNEWTWVNFGFADTDSGGAGTVDRAAVTDYQLRVTDTNTPVTVWVNAVAHYPKSTAYPNGVVSIAFDDNHISQFTLARPALDALGIGATAFTIVEALGTAGSMTTAQLNQLQDVHGWEVAGHAYTLAAHAAGFTTLSAGALDTELRNLRDWLLRNGHKGADLFAYPLGNENAAVRAAVDRYFTLARQIVRKPTQQPHVDQPMRVRSYSVSNSDSLATMQGVVDKAANEDTWLIITMHQLVSGAATAGTQWPIADFQSLMTYVDGKGMPVETIGQVLDTLH